MYFSDSINKEVHDSTAVLQHSNLMISCRRGYCLALDIFFIAAENMSCSSGQVASNSWTCKIVLWDP